MTCETFNQFTPVEHWGVEVLRASVFSIYLLSISYPFLSISCPPISCLFLIHWKFSTCYDLLSDMETGWKFMCLPWVCACLHGFNWTTRYKKKRKKGAQEDRKTRETRVEGKEEMEKEEDKEVALETGITFEIWYKWAAFVVYPVSSQNEAEHVARQWRWKRRGGQSPWLGTVGLSLLLGDYAAYS